VFPPLACTVRGCGDALHPHGRTVTCARGHSYDVARAGYLNLLQPQDRKSLDAGDTRAAVEARAGLLAAGVGAAAIDAVVHAAVTHLADTLPPTVIELGSGSGETLGALARRRPIVAAGIDLSVHAATWAARHHPGPTWVVANADRRLPVLDASADAVLSVHARRNPAECHRILRPHGHLVVAVPAADDLIELRTLVQGVRIERDRAALLIDEHASHFTVTTRTAVRQTLALTRDQLQSLLRGTYRGERLSAAPQVQALESMTVTLASDVVVFRPRG
jgi:23S rRNA (guanine745-N1)-methyltransferase